MATTAVTGTVYQRRGILSGGDADAGSIEILAPGGFSIDVYQSNSATQPTGTLTQIRSLMSKTGTLTVVGFSAVPFISTWIMFDVLTGTPTINTTNVI